MPIIDIIAMFAAAAALGCVLLAALADVRRFEIPDGLSIVIAAAAVVYGFATPGFLWWSHIAAPLTFFALGLFVFTRGWMGGGDIKLMTAIAAWTGAQGFLLLFVGVALSGGVLALSLLAARSALAGRPASNTPRVFHTDAPLPYAVAIAAGTLWWAAQAWPVL